MRSRRLVVASVAVAAATAVGGLVPAAPAAARTDPYRFMVGGSSPAFWWDGCSRIDIGIDLRFAERVGLDPGWERTRWESVLSEVSHYSRYRFRLVDVRTTSSRLGPRAVGGTAGAEVLVTYGSDRAPRQFRYPRLSNDAIQAYAGPQWSGRQALRGAVVVNTRSVHRGFSDARMAPKWAGVDPIRSIYMHEFSHVLGLDHVTDDGQLMYPYLDTDRDDVLGPGDRRALRILSRRPCHATGERGPATSGGYVPDTSIMPIGDASSDPPELCPPTGDCLPTPTPTPTPSPTPTGTPAPVPTGGPDPTASAPAIPLEPVGPPVT